MVVFCSRILHAPFPLAEETWDCLFGDRSNRVKTLKLILDLAAAGVRAVTAVWGSLFVRVSF